MSHGRRGVPFVEKYRPVSLDDIVGNDTAVMRLKILSERGNVPNMIICGPPGTGKTVSVNSLAQKLLGEEYRNAVLEIGASDMGGGVDFVRSTIKTFAKKKVSLTESRHKLVLIDEAEALQNSSQQVIRRIMEMYSRTTRFIFVCNSSSRLIEPLQSRCAIVRFSKLDDRCIEARVESICNREGAVFTKKGLEAIVFTAGGDMRSALSNLQATHTGVGTVNESNVYRMCDTPRPDAVLKILVKCANKDHRGAMKDVKFLKDMGYSSHDIVGTFFRVCRDGVLSATGEEKRMGMLKEIAAAHVRVSEGLTSVLQLERMCSRMCK